MTIKELFLTVRDKIDKDMEFILEKNNQEAQLRIAGTMFGCRINILPLLEDQVKKWEQFSLFILEAQKAIKEEWSKRNA